MQRCYLVYIRNVVVLVYYFEEENYVIKINNIICKNVFLTSIMNKQKSNLFKQFCEKLIFENTKHVLVPKVWNQFENAPVFF